MDDFADVDFNFPADPPPAPKPAPPAPIQQPRPQAKAAPTPAPKPAGPKVVQPIPQKLKRPGASAIIVSGRQKGNPILTHIRNVPWEYGDIVPDFVIGATRCALFLSLKYHRLHPEYIYTRLKLLGHAFAHRILLVLVDVDTHAEALKELAKTSVVNELALIVCWRASEAGRYLEAYKVYEHAQPVTIRARASDRYADRMQDFVTTPRNINKTDAVALVANFGSLRAAVQARPEQLALIGGWGEKKVQRWCGAVNEPFRMRRAAGRKGGKDVGVPLPRLASRQESGLGAGVGLDPESEGGRARAADSEAIAELEGGGQDYEEWQPGGDEWGAGADDWQPGNDSEAGRLPVVAEPDVLEPLVPIAGGKRTFDQEIDGGVAVALARLRSSGDE